MAAEEYKGKSGIVLILDVLGVGSMSVDQCSAFLQKRDSLIEGLKTGHERLASIAQHHGSKSKSPDVATFGDTILLTWEVPKHTGMALFSLANWWGQCVAVGMQLQLPFRGAISTGQYIEVHGDKPSVIGPAVADAAAWYEMAQWLGVIATPACGNMISLLREQTRHAKERSNDFLTALSALFVEYDVPLKGGNHRLWTLSWPARFLLMGDEKASAEERFWNAISGFQIPFGTQDKFANTVKFFEWYISKHGDVISKMKEKGMIDTSPPVDIPSSS